MERLLQAMNTSEIITEDEARAIISQYLRENGDPDKAKDILDTLSFYGWCKMVFDGVIAGDFIITGVGEDGLEYRWSEKAKRRLH